MIQPVDLNLARTDPIDRFARGAFRENNVAILVLAQGHKYRSVSTAWTRMARHIP